MRVLVDDEKKFKKLFKKYFEKYATITIENLDQQFTAKLKKILNKLNKDIASQINDIIKEQLDLTENEKYKLREQHFNKISKAIRDAEKSAKRSIGLKSFSIEQQIRKEIIGSLGYGETFKRLCGDVKKIVVKDFYIEQKDYEIMKKDAVADVKEKVEMELCSPGEIKKMKNRLKETLLKELKEEQMKKMPPKPSIANKVEFKQKRSYENGYGGHGYGGHRYKNRYDFGQHYDRRFRK